MQQLLRPIWSLKKAWNNKSLIHEKNYRVKTKDEKDINMYLQLFHIVVLEQEIAE